MGNHPDRLLALAHPIGYVAEVQQAGFVQFRLKVACVDYGPGQSVGALASELLETFEHIWGVRHRGLDFGRPDFALLPHN